MFKLVSVLWILREHHHNLPLPALWGPSCCFGIVSSLPIGYVISAPTGVSSVPAGYPLYHSLTVSCLPPAFLLLPACPRHVTFQCSPPP